MRYSSNVGDGDGRDRPAALLAMCWLMTESISSSVLSDRKSGILKERDSPASDGAYNWGSLISSFASTDDFSLSTTVSGEIGGDSGMPAVASGTLSFEAIVCAAIPFDADDVNDVVAIALFNDEAKLSWRCVSGGESREAIEKGLCFGGGVASTQVFIVCEVLWIVEVQDGSAQKFGRYVRQAGSRM